VPGRPEWVAAGRFAQQYEQVMLLRAAVGTAAPQATVPALSAADLVGAALEAFATDEDLLAAERARVRMLLVDDAQHFDPQAARLVRVLAGAADTAVIAGDPHQAVFGFRGADARLLLADPDVTLEHSHRCAPAIARAIGGFGRFPLEGSGEVGGDVTVTVAASAHAECSLIADTLRRAHLVDGVPWSQLAVIVRSVEAAAALPRTLAAAGVPVDLSPLAGPITDQPAVRAGGSRRRPRRRAGRSAAHRTRRPARPGIAAPAAKDSAPQRDRAHRHAHRPRPPATPGAGRSGEKAARGARRRRVVRPSSAAGSR
jgi:UvrD/REP helicase N-terminal domain